MARLQIRWQSVGRAAAIAAAVIAGIVSLPALLGSDRPPPVPPDVGLRPAPVASAPPPAPGPDPAPPAAPKREPGVHHRLVKRRHRPHPRPHRGRPRPAHHGHSRPPQTAPPPVTAPTYVPPVYSYVPPPPRSEFGIER